MIIDGKQIAKEIIEDIKNKVDKMDAVPKILAIILGENPSSESYLKMLDTTCKKAGFECEIMRLPLETSEEALVEIITLKNTDSSTNGILVQMPLPRHIDEEKILLSIAPNKDVDGFHPINAGRLFKGEKSLRPCTPSAVMKILEAKNVELTGKHVAVIGRSNIVGKPLSIMLLEKNATVTICHSKTSNIEALTRLADIIVVAVGKPKFLKRSMVKEGSIVIDVGTNLVEGKLIGDADFDNLVDYVDMITPVPGGVGPITNAILLNNIFEGMNM